MLPVGEDGAEGEAAEEELRDSGVGAAEGHADGRGGSGGVGGLAQGGSMAHTSVPMPPRGAGAGMRGPGTASMAVRGSMARGHGPGGSSFALGK
jgi:hypothetical protein